MSISTEGLARACATHPKRTLAAWLVAMFVSFVVIALLLGDALTSDGDVTSNPDSKQASALIRDSFPPQPTPSEIVVVRSERYMVDDPAFKAKVLAIGARGEELGVVADAQSYYGSHDESLVSKDRHATMVPLLMRSDEIVPLTDLVKSENGQDGFQVAITGSLTADADFEKLSEEDLQKGELFIGLPAALIILVLVFGAVVAGLVPVLLGLLSIVIAVALTALVGQFFEVSFFVVNMISAMGLALGIDYSLFILSRYREERVRGLEKMDAIVASGATASRAVLFSGMAFVLAMFGMVLVPDTILRSLALGAILVGIVSVLAALTLLPAVLSLLGDRVNALRIPVIGRRAISSAGSESRFWGALVGAVMRRPLASLVAATTLLLAFALPVLAIDTGFSGLSTLPDRFPSKQGFVALNRDFPGTGVDPARIVIQGDTSSAPVESAIGQLKASLADEPAFGAATQVESEGGDVVLISVPVAGDADGPEATSAIRHLRSDLIPQAFGDLDTTVLVGGTTAEDVDYFAIVGSWLPLVFAFVLGLSFILLTVAFRSIVIPAVAIALNLLSVGAAYGLLVLVFQKGVGNGIFGFQQVDTIEAWVPLFLFSVLFGLSMDYQVFLLSRIKERYAQTGDTAGSVAFGVGSTARLITGAALIIIAVFGGFAAGDLVMFQQMGFGVAVALLIDATIVRTVLVPASMKLLGEWNWYLPSWLSWIPEVHVEGHASKEPAVKPPDKPAIVPTA
ncbi:MAG: putative drug exporter of the superfamily [Gaiellaceae bacterium]|nr:putative drug exporter of the superfamily [Gaiellaceae bacterium]